MLDDRKAAILRAVVEEYIETAQPVGSGHVAAAPGVDVSSATVRNEMVQLEADGFLRQPHTSAGRVPTERGYRFFVDHLQPPGLRGQPAEQVRAFFDRAHGEVEQMLAATGRLLTNLTDLASVVVAPSPAAATIRSVQLVDLTTSAALVVVVLSDGTVEKHPVQLGPGTSAGRVSAATTHLSLHLAGAPRSSLPPVPGTGDEVVDQLVERTVEVLSSPPRPNQPEHVYVGGAARVAEAFDAIETVRQVLSILEQQYLVVTLLRDVLNRGLQVAIGSETGVEPLAGCSLVVAPYESEGQRLGTIGVLGPTRMNYPQALAAVAVVSDRLSDHLLEG